MITDSQAIVWRGSIAGPDRCCPALASESAGARLQKQELPVSERNGGKESSAERRSLFAPRVFSRGPTMSGSAPRRYRGHEYTSWVIQEISMQSHSWLVSNRSSAET